MSSSLRVIVRTLACAVAGGLLGGFGTAALGDGATVEGSPLLAAAGVIAVIGVREHAAFVAALERDAAVRDAAVRARAVRARAEVLRRESL